MLLQKYCSLHKLLCDILIYLSFQNYAAVHVFWQNNLKPALLHQIIISLKYAKHTK